MERTIVTALSEQFLGKPASGSGVAVAFRIVKNHEFVKKGSLGLSYIQAAE
jgi:hypothetical protein